MSTCEMEREREREIEMEGERPIRFVCWTRATELKIVRERERERGTNKVFVSDACDRIEDCRRESERETEHESGRGGGRVLCIKD